MKAYHSYLFLLLLSIASTASAENRSHIKFMEPMIPFQVCVLDTSQSMFSNKTFVKLHSKESGMLGHEIWLKVLKECKDHVFSDKTKGLILLAYEGNTQKTLGYLEGFIYSARNYVFIKSLEYKRGQSKIKF